MKSINWKVRFNNPVFIASLLLSIVTPILAYFGLNLSDLTSWDKLGALFINALKNPYILILVAVNVYNTIIDPTTKGIKDSEDALSYEKPNT